MARKPRWGHTGRTIAVYLPQDQIELLDQLAYEERTNVSELVRRAVRKAFILPSDASKTNVECRAS